MIKDFTYFKLFIPLIIGIYFYSFTKGITLEYYGNSFSTFIGIINGIINFFIIYQLLIPKTKRRKSKNGRSNT